jgi:hypothetical protein
MAILLIELKDGTMYKDLGRNHFDRRSSDQQRDRLVKRFPTKSELLGRKNGGVRRTE